MHPDIWKQCCSKVAGCWTMQPSIHLEIHIPVRVTAAAPNCSQHALDYSHRALTRPRRINKFTLIFSPQGKFRLSSSPSLDLFGQAACMSSNRNLWRFVCSEPLRWSAAHNLWVTRFSLINGWLTLFYRGKGAPNLPLETCLFVSLAK